jgi:hypothetical protein|tara:strand:- start:475 stop:612 length:138 start_codon:yes stop_codon:yes gene_type:complete
MSNIFVAGYQNIGRRYCVIIVPIKYLKEVKKNIHKQNSCIGMIDE